MRRRLGPSQWLLLALGLLLVAGAAEYVRASLRDRSAVAPSIQKGAYDTAFEEGGGAPDFELSDRTGKPRRLSQLARNEALLSFVTDDVRCRALLRYVASLAERRRLAGKALPAFVTVADFPPGREQAFLRETGLKQVVLYEEKGGAVARQYRAEARPRCFQLIPGLRVAVIGSSPAVARLFDVGNEVLFGWRLRSPSLHNVDLRAPEPNALKRFDPPRPSAGEASTSGGASASGPSPAASPSR